MRSNEMPRFPFVLVVALALTLVAAACGGSDDDEADAGSDDTTETTLAGAVPTEQGEQFGDVEVVGTPLAAMPQQIQVTDASNDAAIGTLAPTLRGTNFDGSEVIVDGDGNPKVLMFVAHWCPHCQEEVPLVVDMMNRGQVPDGLEIIAVSTAVQEGQPNFPPQDWLVDEAWPGEVMRDSGNFDALRAYGAGGFPFTVYLSGENLVVARSVGQLDEATIESLWLAAAEA